MRPTRFSPLALLPSEPPSTVGQCDLCNLSPLLAGPHPKLFYSAASPLVRPGPLVDSGFVDSFFVRIVLTLDLLVSQHLLCMCSGNLQGGNTVNHIDSDAEAI